MDDPAAVVVRGERHAVDVLDRPLDAVHTADATCVSHANVIHANADAVTLYDDGERIVFVDPQRSLVGDGCRRKTRSAPWMTRD